MIFGYLEYLKSYLVSLKRFIKRSEICRAMVYCQTFLKPLIKVLHVFAILSLILSTVSEIIDPVLEASVDVFPWPFFVFTLLSPFAVRIMISPFSLLGAIYAF